MAFYQKGDEKYLDYNEKICFLTLEKQIFCLFWIECNIFFPPSPNANTIYFIQKYKMPNVHLIQQETNMSTNKYYFRLEIHISKVYKQGWITNIMALTHSYGKKQHIKAISHTFLVYLSQGCKLVSYTVLDLQFYIYVFFYSQV